MPIGYSSARIVYKLWDVELKKSILSRSVTCDIYDGTIVDMDTESHTDEDCEEVPTAPEVEVKPHVQSSAQFDTSQTPTDSPEEPES